jgi:hypothetical protein
MVNARLKIWRFGPHVLSSEIHPEKLWRELQGIGRFEKTAEITLRFITIGPSEADAERPFSVQQSLQGLDGTNYRTGMLPARLLLDEPR